MDQNKYKTRQIIIKRESKGPFQLILLTQFRNQSEKIALTRVEIVLLKEINLKNVWSKFGRPKRTSYQMKLINNVLEIGDQLQRASTVGTPHNVHRGGKDQTQIEYYKKSNIQHKLRKQWSQQEDLQVIRLVGKLGKNWKLIEENMQFRTGKQIRERWINKLDTNLNFNPFSQIEDNTILLLFNQHGPKWSEISKSMPGRPENMVKNRFYSHIRKQLMNKGESTEDLIDITSQSSSDEMNDQVQQKQIQENWPKNVISQNMNRLDTIQSVKEDHESLRPIDFLVGAYNRESSLINQIECDGQIQMPINSLESNRQFNPFSQFKQNLFQKGSMSIEEEYPFTMDPNTCFYSIPMPEFQNHDPQEINYIEQLFLTNQQQY